MSGDMVALASDRKLPRREMLLGRIVIGDFVDRARDDCKARREAIRHAQHWTRILIGLAARRRATFLDMQPLDCRFS